MTAVLTIIGLCVLLVWAVLTIEQRRQRPLSEFSKKDMEAAFRFAPEKLAVVVNRGTLSRYEYVELVKLNLARINAELARRGERR